MPKTRKDFLMASVAEFISLWTAGGDAVLRLESCKGQATLSLQTNLGRPEDLHPSPQPPRIVRPEKPAPGNSLPSLFPNGTPTSSSPNRLRSAARQRRSHHRTCLHKAKVAAVKLPPPSSGSLRALAMAAQPASVLRTPPSLPEPAVSAAPSPPVTSWLAPPPMPGPPSPPSPIPQLDGGHFSPSDGKGDATVTGLVINCLNCKGTMSPSHQCEETLVAKPKPPRRLKPMKFCDNCDTLYQSGTKCLACVTPAPTR